MAEPAQPHTYSGPLEWYWHFSQREDFESDPAQLVVLEHLEKLQDDLTAYKESIAGPLNRLLSRLGRGKELPNGLYIYGTVGRGKSLLMDAFFEVSPLKRKRRIHFHAFMRDLHARLAAASGVADPLDTITDQLAREVRLLCFDEFHVSDIADAMILGRLFTYLFEKGVVVVATSNYHPDDLYPNGLHRDRFIPAIEIIKVHLDVIEIAGKGDHRRRLLESMAVYHTPLGAAADAALTRTFEALSAGDSTPNVSVTINERPFQARQLAKHAIWFDFAEIGYKATGQGDYLAMAERWETVVISGVPQLHAKRDSSAVRRLTWLVDVFYDQRVKLVLSAAVPPDQLVMDERGQSATAGAVTDSGAASVTTAGESDLHISAEFARTVSRLKEMQSKDYFSLARRTN